MSIRPVDLNGMLQNTQATAQIAHGEDSKSELLTQQAVVQNEKNTEQAANRVSGKDDLEGEEYKFDPREKSGNEYQGNGKEKKKKNNAKQDGFVRIKGMSSGFDVTV